MTADDLRADLEARLVLLALDGIGPSRLSWLIRSTDAPRVVDELRRRRLPAACGEPPPGVNATIVNRWFDGIGAIDGARLVSIEQSKGHGILTPHDDRWPFADDPEPPALIFYRGNLGLLAAPPAVAVVGTRRCTTVGRTVAHRMGSDLARAGIGVVSGLALGVDAAAHHGAIESGGAVVGVVASGLDVVYPSANRRLWEQVAGRGLLLSESPAGTSPDRWRFPARNRLIAALSCAAVIIESHRRGGSLSTADEVADRGWPVFAVPGSVTNPAADGTNELLVDGAVPARTASDVLAFLGLSEQPQVGGDGHDSSADPTVVATDVTAQDGVDGGADVDGWRGDQRSILDGDDDLCRRIRNEVASGPCPIDHLVLVLRSSLSELLAATYLLVAGGQVVFDGGTVAPAGWVPDPETTS